MAESQPRVRRGPKPSPDPGTNTGFRITDRERFELQLAQSFVGARNLQAVISIAVSEFLMRMRDVPGYSDATKAAEASQRARAGVRSLGSAQSEQEP